jgi:formylglycine-generating enzyme required for sulfatase activity
MAKIALLIGVSEYEEGLDPLPAAAKDIEALREVLVNPNIGGFAEKDVTVLSNPQRQTMEDEIYTLFANRQKDDLVLLYFSGHGVLDESNRFYFATRQTLKDQGKLRPTTALVATTVQDYMEQSKSQRQVVILDSCFSGAFAKGVQAKDSGSVNLDQFLGGKGRAILTASTSTQYALTQDGFELSIYTHFLVEGLRTGGADKDRAGWITVEDLHGYASAKVKEAAPAMTPEFYPVKEGYTIKLAQSQKDDPALKYRQEVQKRVVQGNFSIPARQLLNSLRRTLKLQGVVADRIEDEVLRPFQEYQRKLQDYEETLRETLEVEPVLSDRTLEDLLDYQQHLGLRDEDVASLKSELSGRDVSAQTLTKIFEFEVVTVNDRGQEINRKPGRAEYFTETLGNGVTLDMVRIPGGTFQMGSTASKREQPIHNVTVAPFFMGKYQITQAQYESIMGKNPSSLKGAEFPVEQVSWNDAVEFCRRISEKCGNLYRLPSEAEWEYACRAGTKTPFCFGETITKDLVNYNGFYCDAYDPQGQYRAKTIPVGMFQPNNFGLYDMHGNVWEWCADHWHQNYMRAPIDGSAWLDKNDKDFRLIRGGALNSEQRYCRSAYRGYNTPDYRDTTFGFRVVCSASRNS